MAASDVMAEMAGMEAEQPGSLFHIGQDYDNGNRSEKPCNRSAQMCLKQFFILVLQTRAVLLFKIHSTSDGEWH